MVIIKTLLIAALFNIALSICQTVRHRRDFNTLSTPEKDSFFNAIDKMRRLPSKLGIDGASQSLFEDFAYIHIQNQNEIHFVDQFLVWHRRFTLAFEDELNLIDPTWKWTVDAQNPAESKLLTAQHFGTNGIKPSKCVVDGKITGFFEPAYEPSGENRACLKREYTVDTDYPLGFGEIGAFAGPEVIEFLKQNSATFGVFQYDFEVNAHAAIHTGLGGSMSDMRSPADLLFFLHHGMVDKIWSEWQDVKGMESRYNEYGGNSNETLAFYGEQVFNFLDYRSLCYVYDNLPHAPTTTKSADPTTNPIAPTTKQIVPTTKPAESTTKPADPTTKTVDPTTKPADQTTKLAQPTTKPADLTTKPVDPTTKPAEPTTKPTEPTTKPVDPTIKPFDPTSKPADTKTKPSEATTKPAEPTTKPAADQITQPPPYTPNKPNAYFCNPSNPKYNLYIRPPIKLPLSACKKMKHCDPVRLLGSQEKVEKAVYVINVAIDEGRWKDGEMMAGAMKGVDSSALGMCGVWWGFFVALVGLFF